MKLRRILPVLFALAAVSSVFLSTTLSRYVTEYEGSDTALVAEWNFKARGEDDLEGMFYNKGFTFDLFSARSVKPMDFGSKSFTFTGGGSDTAIAYDVQMKATDLLSLTGGTVAETEVAEIDAPFIFRLEVSVNEGAADPPPAIFSPALTYGGDWFRPEDIETDEEGYFSIFDKTTGIPHFSVHSTDLVTVTVYWQWNTSCYINGTGAANVSPDVTTAASGYPPYYQEAYDAYYGPDGLDERRIAASDAVADYLSVNGGPSPDGTWEHYEEYNALVAAEDEAVDACRRSLLKAYDDYDTLAMDALGAKESVKVVFRITGEQIAPE